MPQDRSARRLLWLESRLEPISLNHLHLRRELRAASIPGRLLPLSHVYCSRVDPDLRFSPRPANPSAAEESISAFGGFQGIGDHPLSIQARLTKEEEPRPKCWCCGRPRQIKITIKVWGTPWGHLPTILNTICVHLHRIRTIHTNPILLPTCLAPYVRSLPPFYINLNHNITNAIILVTLKLVILLLRVLGLL
jgi:hypothetical protein